MTRVRARVPLSLWPLGPRVDYTAARVQNGDKFRSEPNLTWRGEGTGPREVDAIDFAALGLKPVGRRREDRDESVAIANEPTMALRRVVDSGAA